MRLLDFTLATPAANLAADEALLDDREARGGPAVLRFWESPLSFVVVGYAARVSEEVDLSACQLRGIPVLRRCSGGGTVLQGPGCLNYAVVGPLAAVGPSATIRETNQFVLERHRAALAPRLDQPVAIAGHTDLVLDHRKFSGNAQRRRRAWFLFHGTFLLDFDVERMATLLRLPRRQPDYRRQRDHREFLTRLPLTRDQIKAALQAAWKAAAPGPADETSERSRLQPAIDRLIHERYGTDAWNRAWL